MFDEKSAQNERLRPLQIFCAHIDRSFERGATLIDVLRIQNLANMHHTINSHSSYIKLNKTPFVNSSIKSNLILRIDPGLYLTVEYEVDELFFNQIGGRVECERHFPQID